MKNCVYLVSYYVDDNLEDISPYKDWISIFTHYWNEDIIVSLSKISDTFWVITTSDGYIHVEKRDIVSK